MNTHLQRALNTGLDYAAYIDHINELVATKKSSGPNQSADLVNYTKLNASRMRRLNKTAKMELSQQQFMEELTRPLTWLIITESWCGDAAQILPIINRLAAAQAGIALKLVFRDEHPELMDQFLINGARSIPVIIFVDEEKAEVLGSWGPRPAELQAQVMARKQETNPAPYAEFQQGMQKWYNQDKGKSTLREFLTALSTSLAVAPTF